MKIPSVSPKTKLILLSIAAALLLYSLAGFLLLPAVLSAKIPGLIRGQLKREAQLQTIHFNPFSWELSVDQFMLKNPAGGDFLRFDRFYLNLAAVQSIAEQGLKLDQVILERPVVSLQRHKNGEFNFSDLLPTDQPEEKEEEDNELLPFIISRLTISEGTIAWEDSYHSPIRRETVYPLNLSLNDLSTRLNAQSQLEFSIQLTSGGILTWQGQLGINPLLSTGHIELNQVKLRRIWELLLNDTAAFEILSGKERIAADYRLSESASGLQLQLEDAAASIIDAKVAEKGSQDALIDIPDFNLSGVAFDLQQQSVMIGKVAAKNAVFNAWLNPDGTINYQALFASGANDESTPPRQDDRNDNKPAWRIGIGQLALNDFSMHFIDKTLAEPAHLDITTFNLSSHDLANKPGSPLPLKLGLTVNDGGTLVIEGQASVEPFGAQLQIKAADIAIADFQPYIDQAVRLDVLSGLFHADIDLAMTQKQDQALAMTVQGNSRITEFVGQDQISNRDFLKWQQLGLNGINLDLAANSYHVDTVDIDQPYIRILIRKNKSINVNDIVVGRPDTAQAEPTQAETPKPSLSFGITKINLRQGESDFSDLSLILPFSAHINQLDGSVQQVSSVQDSIADITLAGKVDSLAPVNIKGTLSPYRGDSQFDLAFDSMPMPLMTPYMAEFVGRKIEKGNMSLGLHYKIKNQQLTASNKLSIENLVLGERVENPQAVSLPLDFAIALLQDSNGMIALDVPITGSLEDPEFNVSAIVVDALVNVITKVVSSPFTALGSLIGSDEDISKVSFPAGSAKLDDEQRKKLDDLAEILLKRPGLKVEIKGTAFSERDWPPLQSEALDKQLLQIKANELKRANPKKPVPENIELSDQDYHRLLADLFIRQFPQLAERSLFGTPRLLDPRLGEFYHVAKTRLAAALPPDPQGLQQLAGNRTKNIAKHLIDRGIAVNRLFLLDADIDPKNMVDQTASQLSLTVR